MGERKSDSPFDIKQVSTRDKVTRQRGTKKREVSETYKIIGWRWNGLT